ncbi:helix-turn-helix domain-containing protein [Neotabrizicola shimadae]|uniref:Helix-turn-helix transcriptional regulator n=1 Tax=Neotabrizicola shimadae TaxID=2807096 RepID=A0A8G0ZVU4_9RHOB|nr:helix-turn-helix transcriptional regulator [Neotabrizicola shimadae]QYZ69608.1 helix-turn-helix transcriptional regulator [Neotabrizicola shimadae]
MTKDNLTENLRFLTGYAPSVKEICAKAGVNRTQFHRYLAGGSMPSLRSLRRICDYFGVEDHEVMLDHDRFRELIRLRPPRLGHAPDPYGEALTRLNTGDAVPRVSMGFYHLIFRPESEVDLYYRSLIRMRTEAGGIVIRQIERFPRPALALPRRMTYEGTAYTRHGKLFAQVQEIRYRRSAWFSVLSIGDFANPRILHGRAVGTEPEGTAGILSFPVVWLHLDEQLAVRAALGACGYFRAAEMNLAPEVANVLDSFA